MRRSRIGLLCAAAVLTVAGTLPPVAAMAQPSPTPEPTAPATAPPPSKHGDMHGDMLKGVLHGEGIVQTTNGPVRVAMQKGEATRVSTTSVTVRSSDGYTRVWRLDDSTKVYGPQHTAQPGALQVGANVAIAGTAPAATTESPAGNTFTAKWVMVRPAETAPPSS